MHILNTLFDCHFVLIRIYCIYNVFWKRNKSYDETHFNDSRNCGKSEEGQDKYVLCAVIIFYHCELFPFYNAAFVYTQLHLHYGKLPANNRV